MKVIIVGGSLVGLMHGIMLKHHGHDVVIFEQTPRDLQAQGAGLALGPKVQEFFTLHDRLESTFYCIAEVGKSLDRNGNVVQQTRWPAKVTSWEALYYRLRANFDGHASPFCEKVPAEDPADGKTIYEVGKKVVSIEDGQNRKVNVTYEDMHDGTTSTSVADLVIGADGANSIVRKLVYPGAPKRRYAGYVLWRGIVPEKDLSPLALEHTTKWFTFAKVPHAKGVALTYPIPGDNGNLTEGERGINFAWYTHLTADQLTAALTDVDGRKHRWSVPMGKLNLAVWATQLKEAQEQFGTAYIEILQKIKKPFIQVIGDYLPRKASFSDGRILLVGDALALIRPHTTMGLPQGAYHALSLEKVLTDSSRKYEEGIRDWERQVVDFGYMEGLRSICQGESILGGWSGWLPAAIRYHGLLYWRSWKAKVRGVFGRMWGGGKQDIET